MHSKCSNWSTRSIPASPSVKRGVTHSYYRSSNDGTKQHNTTFQPNSQTSSECSNFSSAIRLYHYLLHKCKHSSPAFFLHPLSPLRRVSSNSVRVQILPAYFVPRTSYLVSQAWQSRIVGGGQPLDNNCINGSRATAAATTAELHNCLYCGFGICSCLDNRWPRNTTNEDAYVYCEAVVRIFWFRPRGFGPWKSLRTVMHFILPRMHLLLFNIPTVNLQPHSIWFFANLSVKRNEQFGSFGSYDWRRVCKTQERNMYGFHAVLAPWCRTIPAPSSLVSNIFVDLDKTSWIIIEAIRPFFVLN